MDGRRAPYGRCGFTAVVWTPLRAVGRYPGPRAV